jgi:imidazolonepropionase-like amidohydrolase
MKIFFKLLPRLLLSVSLLNPMLVLADDNQALLLHAARVFDGTKMRTNTSVLIEHGKIVQIDSNAAFKNTVANVIELGDATLLPSLIDLHSHIAFQKIPEQTILANGIGTVRDVGGVVHQPYGGDGSLRVLTSGQIITAPNGYPIPMMGADNLAIPVADETQARQAVCDLINGGAVIIKIALEVGNEIGAPWTGHHHGHSSHETHPKTMPLLSEAIVKAIVDEAHQHHRKVTAHLAEANGVKRAINAGVDEWAHTPCDVIPQALLKKAVAQGVKIVSTLDTLSKCTGVTQNAHIWTALGGEWLYGAEIAHPDVPWGIDAQELNLLMHLAQLSPLDVLHTATAKAGQYLNIPLLGTLQHGAPADLIAVKADVTHNFKALEYPDLVISGGKIVVNHFENQD